MILVTGGTGLVGSHLLYYLSQTEEKIRATYRSETSLEAVKHVFSYYSEDHEALFNKIQWVQTSLNDIPRLTEAFKNITHVYHSAAMVSFDPNRYHELRKTNIEGTANIVNLCISNNVEKLCHVSSVAAIGSPELNAFADEETPWNQDADNSIYAITKYGAEMEIWRGIQEGVKAVIVNPGIIIGPGFWRTSSGSLIKRVYKGLNYYTTGINGYIDIHDVIKCMLELMTSSIQGERYILVAENLSFKYFADHVAKGLNKKPPNKEASKFILEMVWRLDWLNYLFKRKRRRLTKHMVRSISKDSYYSNDKIIKTLNIRFKPVDLSIKETSLYFLKDLE